MTIPKIYTLHNPKDFHRCTQPQSMIFMVFDGDLVKITYQMGDSIVPNTVINIKWSKDKPMELHHSQSKDFTLNAARTVWDWLVDELGWVNGG